MGEGRGIVSWPDEGRKESFLSGAFDAVWAQKFWAQGALAPSRQLRQAPSRLAGVREATE